MAVRAFLAYVEDHWSIFRPLTFAAMAGLLTFAGLLAVHPNISDDEYIGDVLTTEAPARFTVHAANAPTEDCNWGEEVGRTIGELGADPNDWFVMSGGSMTGLAGVAHLDDGTVTLNPAQPCEHVADTVRHEWMHLQQGRLYGGWEETITAMGSRERAELVADCGAKLLGATYLPYIADGCPQDVLAEAKRLIQVNR